MDDAWRPKAADLAEALMLLTRLPVPVHLAAPRGARAAWAWPLAGALVAGLAAMVAAGALAAGLPPGLAAGLALVAGVLLTGALHEDGLADTADGLWGGHTRKRRLEILRDSRIGTYGVVALVLVLGLRWQALVALAADPWALAAAMVAAAALSRAAMAGVAWALPPARPDGLSAATGRPPAGAAALAAGIAGGLALVSLGLTAVAAGAAAALAAAWIARVAHRRFGGQTGDILGASQQLAEGAVLLVCVALAVP
jgi:adenosylcobinamide-GDP ribazoletransferase